MITKSLVKKILKLTAVIAVIIFVYIYFSAFLPVLLALLTALMFEPFVRWLKLKMKVRKRVLPVTITFTLFIAISSLLVYITLTRVVETIYNFTLQIPTYAFQVQRFINDVIIRFNELIEDIPIAHVVIRELENQSNSVVETALDVTSYLLTILGSWIQSVPNLIFVSLIYLMTLFLFSLDLPRLKRLFYNLFNRDTSEKLRFVNQRLGKVFLGYWKAQFILSIGVFVITYASLLFISPGAALIMSVIIWLVDIIPLYVGPALVLIPWGLLAMMLGNVGAGIQLILLALIITILRRIIEPKVLGDSIGLAALPTVLSMYFGFVFFGVMGLILGPFVYIAILSAKESGLFDLGLSKKDEEII